MTDDVVKARWQGVMISPEGLARKALARIRTRGADPADAGILEASQLLEGLRGLIRGQDLDDDDPLWALFDEAQALLVEIRANTVGGAVVKLKFFRELADIDLRPRDDLSVKLLSSVLATLEAIGGGGHAA